ncbi:MAG: LacI family DNA-binding transcriptional regulator [Gammaproteobacteria bacterium]|nr:LacI family DNA-binding transcriptional regulator [Gammaproteobacteria bacterium]
MATIYDVAKAAGVSPKTVSRVLNGDAPVGERTRKVVEEAITQLGYVPSSAARTMRSNRSGLIGLITGALSHQLEPAEPAGLPELYIVQGIQQVLINSDKTLMIADTGGESARVRELVRTFVQHRAEALIYVADYHRQVELDTQAASCPVVLVNCFDDAGTLSIVPDDEQCQFELVSDLIQSGHKRIAYLTLNTNTMATRLRSAGYRRALKESGLPYDPQLELVASGTDDDVLLDQAVKTAIAMTNPPSVFCCGNDEMAMRVYGLLRTNGLRIPEDISVAGFDNYRAIAERLYPPLTTVELPYFAMGQSAANTVLKLISGDSEKPTGSEKIAGPVHWRSSVTALNSVTKFRSNQRRRN